MNKFDIYLSQDVTGCLVFGKDFEVFFDYEPCDIETILKTGEVFVKEIRDEIILSKGASETSHPLPIVSALAKNFISEFQNNPEALKRENNPDQQVIPALLRKTIDDLKINPSHSREPHWHFPGMITDERIAFPLTLELIDLIIVSNLFFKGDRMTSAQPDFINFLDEYKDYLFYLSNMDSPTYIMNERLKQADLLPVALKPNNMFNEEPKCTFAIRSNAGLLSLAWAELYFAKIHEVPFSICTYCGDVYLLNKKTQRRKDKDNDKTKSTMLSKTINKSSCDKCKNVMRKNRREKDLNVEREKERIRKQNSRDKQKVKEFVLQGKKAEEILNYINDKAKKRDDEEKTIFEIKKWMKEIKK
jgi:hypothetical protein